MPGQPAWGAGQRPCHSLAHDLDSCAWLSPQQTERLRESSLPWGLSSEPGTALGGPQGSAPRQPDSGHPRGGLLNHVGK